jgi:hypothetical protein
MNVMRRIIAFASARSEAAAARAKTLLVCANRYTLPPYPKLDIPAFWSIQILSSTTERVSAHEKSSIPDLYYDDTVWLGCSK